LAFRPLVAKAFEDAKSARAPLLQSMGEDFALAQNSFENGSIPFPRTFATKTSFRSAMTHMPHFNVNGTDRDGQSDDCCAGDSGFQVVFLWF
jgi:hypothetical protein